MIRAEFFCRKQGFSGFSVSGHAGAAPEGSGDVVCAAVSSAVYLTANAITDVLMVNAKVRAGQDGFLSLSVADGEQAVCQPFFRAPWIHLEQLSRQSPQNLKVFQTEK